ncbi:GAF domain-containing protein [Actinomycetospora endophytica]|uniref:GAF domain-containing protein n=1 Tax=Actinomycetospora endophytica TaxID=2291215 RepID=A0ABS8PB34_9PSEU|nr:GAF domain-containing protein [Actinomycetospora endophytica]MCD2195238.1 GAF domain-containing protein [Actinomycetospora endophytica]
MSEPDRTELAAARLPELIAEVARRADEIGRTRDRAEALVEAVVAVASGLDLPSTLRRVVAAAAELVDARYCALGVLSTDRTTLAEFVTVGVDEDELRRRLGGPPRGQGILGLLIDDPRPLRLTDLVAHPAAVGFPHGHPSMHSFLGVPVWVHGEVFGTLYLTEKNASGGFTEDDEGVVTALATAAGVAVDNARLYGESSSLVGELRRTERLLRATGEVTATLLAGSAPGDALALVARHAAGISDADGAFVARGALDGEEERLEVVASVGLDVLPVGRVLRGNDGPLAEVARTGTPRVAVRLLLTGPPDDPGTGPDADLGPVMIVPLRGGAPGDGGGVLVAARRRGGAPFDPGQLPAIASFAEQASVVLHQARMQGLRRDVDLLVDRERIAADLHDHVMQRLYAVGLRLQGVLPRITDGAVSERVGDAVAQLDDVAREIRATIFDLHRAGRPGLSGRLRASVAELTAETAVRPVVVMTGGVDELPEPVGNHLEAVVREAVSNAVRHSGASTVRVSISVGETVEVDVSDDGRGMPEAAVLSGLLNLDRRARTYGGELTIAGREEGPGTRLAWRIPAAPSPDRDEPAR